MMPIPPGLMLTVTYISDKRNLDRYTTEAMESNAFNDAKSDKAKAEAIIQYLYVRVKAKLNAVGHTLDDIISDPTLKQKFESSGRLKAVLAHHHGLNAENRETAGASSSETSLELIVRNVFDKRDELWKRAMREGEGSSENLLAFMLLVRQEFKDQGHSPRELFEEGNKALFNRYFTSGRLGLALDIYQYLFLGKKPTEKLEQEPLSARDRGFRREAIDLARDAADRGEGLATKFGVKDLAPEKARRKARQAMFREHPDKNPEGDAQRFNDAAALMRLIDQGVFDKYEAELARLREGGAKPRGMGRT